VVWNQNSTSYVEVPRLRETVGAVKSRIDNLTIGGFSRKGLQSTILCRASSTHSNCQARFQYLSPMKGGLRRVLHR
jgi:hypothetical protein